MEPVSSTLGNGRHGTGLLLPTLLFYYPEKEKRWKLEVQGDRFTIGRSREVEVCIPHTSVSKKHVLVERRGPKYIFRDLGSKNGSYLNDFRMTRGALSDGDELRVGSIRITFYKAAAPEQAVPPEGGAVAASPSREWEPGHEAPASSVAPQPSRAEQETAALPRKELSDRLATDDEAAPDASQAEVEVEEVLLDAEDPSSGLDGESGDTAAPAAERLRRRPVRQVVSPEEPSLPAAPARTISRARLAGGGLACVALGFVLGYLAATLGNREDSRGASTSTTTSLPPSSAAPGPRAGESEAPADSSAVTAPADITDPTTGRRLIVRLHIDLAGRPPTREELRAFEKLSREELWYEVAKRAGKVKGAGKIPEKPEEAFTRLIGRRPSPEEIAALLEAARGDLDHFAAAVGTSAFYAGAEHRRRRGEAVLARSLFTDLVGYPPGSAEEEAVLAALRNSREGVGAVARTLADSPGSLAGPRPGEPLEAWVDDVYARLLLRPPTGEERKAGAGAAREGWRGWLAGIASGKEYETY